MSKTYHLLRNYIFSALVIITIWILCFIDIPETPLSKFSLIDKWTHFAMYGGLCSVIWMEYLYSHRKDTSISSLKKDMFLWGFLMPFLMGGLIEILQANCTNGRRSGDWLDFLADGIGVLIGQIIGILLARFLSRGKKDN